MISRVCHHRPALERRLWHDQRERALACGPMHVWRGFGGEEADVAVFRFTLGIPGFDDAQIPRVVGAVGAALLAANHVCAAGKPSPAQSRAEALGAVLAAVACVTPALEARLREAVPGRGRAAGGTAGGTPAAQLFALAPGLPQDAKQELAWASYALLRNTNASALLLVYGGRAWLARGAVGAAAAGVADGSAALAALGQAVEFAAQHSPELRGGGLLMLAADRPRALSARERMWAAAVAAKLATVDLSD
ncbi:hypothetical protein WJX81_008371 [Elliptochloris bilobata]|uniref:Uncharacterized protein n=1 Tax=Elliptochloris bilobata TaxID=381761 RepID=A0AAW1QM46_9CHLO